jgi:hypothetical protein
MGSSVLMTGSPAASVTSGFVGSSSVAVGISAYWEIGITDKMDDVK